MIIDSRTHKQYSEFEQLFDIILELDNNIRIGKIIDYRINRSDNVYNVDIKLNTAPDCVEFYLDCSHKDC